MIKFLVRYLVTLTALLIFGYSQSSALSFEKHNSNDQVIKFHTDTDDPNAIIKPGSSNSDWSLGVFESAENEVEEDEDGSSKKSGFNYNSTAYFNKYNSEFACTSASLCRDNGCIPFSTYSSLNIAFCIFRI